MSNWTHPLPAATALLQMLSVFLLTSRKPGSWFSLSLHTIICLNSPPSPVSPFLDVLVSSSAPTAFYLVPQLSSSTLVCIPRRHCKCLKRHTCLCGPCAYSPGKSRILKVKSEAHHRLAGTLLIDHSTVCASLHSLLFLKLFLSLGFPSLNVVCHPIQLKSHFICDVDLVSS